MVSLGYSRHSTQEQNSHLQIDALEKACVARIFTDAGVSGSLASRPALDEMLAYAREGDVILVWKLDRLSRNTKSTLDLLSSLTERGIGFRSLTEGLDTTGPMGVAMLTVLSAFAQLEVDQNRQRTLAGLAAARARGRIGGRPRVLSNAKIEFAKSLRDQGLGVSAIAAELGISRASVYRYLAPAV